VLSTLAARQLVVVATPGPISVPKSTVQVPNKSPVTVVPPPKLAKVDDALAMTTGTPALPMLMVVAVVVPMFRTPAAAVSKP